MSRQIRFLQQILRLSRSRSVTHYTVEEWRKQQREAEQKWLKLQHERYYDEYYDDRDYYYDEEHRE